jgi:hypothetical protein
LRIVPVFLFSFLLLLTTQYLAGGLIRHTRMWLVNKHLLIPRRGSLLMGIAQLCCISSLFKAGRKHLEFLSVTIITLHLWSMVEKAEKRGKR